MATLNTNFNPKSSTYGGQDALFELTADNGAAGESSGVSCTGWKRAVVSLVAVGGTSVVFEIHTQHGASLEWKKEADIGDVTVAAGASSVQIVDVLGFDRFYVRAKTFNGAATAAAYVTLATE